MGNLCCSSQSRLPIRSWLSAHPDPHTIGIRSDPHVDQKVLLSEEGPMSAGPPADFQTDEMLRNLTS